MRRSRRWRRGWSGWTCWSTAPPSPRGARRWRLTFFATRGGREPARHLPHGRGLSSAAEGGGRGADQHRLDVCDVRQPANPAYGASKAAVAQLTKSLAIAWAGDGIRVNAVAPGFIVTQQSARSRTDPAHVAAVTARTPMGRWGEPEDIAAPVLFLASEAAAVHDRHLPRHRWGVFGCLTRRGRHRDGLHRHGASGGAAPAWRAGSRGSRLQRRARGRAGGGAWRGACLWLAGGDARRSGGAGGACHLAQRGALPAGQGDPCRGQACDLRKAAVDDLGRNRRRWWRWRRPPATSRRSATTRASIP